MEDLKQVCVWDMGNTNVDLQGIGFRSLDLIQDRAGDGVLKCLNFIFCNTIGEIACLAGKLLVLHGRVCCWGFFFG